MEIYLTFIARQWKPEQNLLLANDQIIKFDAPHITTWKTNINFWVFYEQHSMSNTLISGYQGRIVFVVIIYALWYLIFGWPILDYPSHAKGPCYSPNHAYYITRHQTLWQSTNLSRSTEFGTARLFDRSGKLLYENDTHIDGQSGPIWYDGGTGEPKDPPEVFFMEDIDSHWMFILPSFLSRQWQREQ